MGKIALDIYDDMPRAMHAYISHYGWHFNKKAYMEAVKQMRKKNPQNGREEPLDAWNKDQVDDLLKRYGVTVENNVMYDAAYQANWCKAYLFRSSVTDEAHVALFVKDTLDGVDGSDEIPFRAWVQKGIATEHPVEWEDLL